MKKQIHPNSMKNLHLFQKGKSGNPGGRPKKLPLTELQRTWLALPAPVETVKKFGFTVKKGEEVAKMKDGTVITNGMMIVIGQMARAIDHTDAAKEIQDRVEGKSLTRLRIEGEDGEALDLTNTEQNEDIAEIKQRLKSISDKLRNRPPKSK